MEIVEVKGIYLISEMPFKAVLISATGDINVVLSKTEECIPTDAATMVSSGNIYISSKGDISCEKTPYHPKLARCQIPFIEVFDINLDETKPVYLWAENSLPIKHYPKKGTLIGGSHHRGTTYLDGTFDTTIYGGQYFD